MKKQLILMILIVSFLVIGISALPSANEDERKERLEFGHSLVIQKIMVSELSPGTPGILNLFMYNNADFSLRDIRVEVDLPEGINFLEDVSKRKILLMDSLESKDLIFNIIASPSISEILLEQKGVKIILFQ